METFMIIVAGVLFAVGTYMLLGKNMLQIILGTALLSHSAHLMLLAVNGLKKGAPPLLGEEAAAYTDPIPHALMLTSIVITFALTAYVLVLGYRAYVEIGFQDMKQLKGYDDE
jgi:multicomponent Na+:H+ antiporter subunit C